MPLDNTVNGTFIHDAKDSLTVYTTTSLSHPAQMIDMDL